MVEGILILMVAQKEEYLAANDVHEFAGESKSL